MLKEAIDRILQLAVPNQITVGDKLYTDKAIQLVQPPVSAEIGVTTLQGLADLLDNEFEDAKAGDDLLVHVEDPFTVSLIGRKSDEYGRRTTYATARYPKECPAFTFGAWFSTENFLIAVQQGFQRILLENEDGTLAKDLDYVITTASKISAESTVSNDDDGITQRVNVQSGVVLKTTVPLQPRVSLAPYRTFAEIDQIVSTFIFRARVNNGAVQLALFEGDGGRWRLAAVAAIKAWLTSQVSPSPIIS